jgi:protein-S-isoprenylcysteine O-methyltransferase Ste14
MVVYLRRHDPALLERRMQSREVEPEQRKMVVITNLLFLIGFLLPGFDFRFGWSQLPALVMIVADVIMLLGYVFITWVFRTNSYASRTIQVEQAQQVIDTGPYAYVRHPMYSGFLLMMVAAPLALGSLWATLVIAGPLPVLLGWRIRGEERVLREQLPGYVDYCERVRWRLVPGLW